MVKPTVISLFAGCGGSSLGYQMAGFNERLAVEWDKNACATFRLNFPDVPLYEDDISKLTGKQCLKISGLVKGELDILDGSPPCQGFSTAGKRKFTDARNTLFKEYVRLLKALNPKVFVMENVTGLVKGVMRQAYLQIVKDLRAAGYNVKGQIMNAAYFGVPQNRKRVIIIGVRNDIEIKPSHPKPHQKTVSTQEAIGHLGNAQDKKSGHVWIDESPAGRNTVTWHLAHQAKQGVKYAGFYRRDVWHHPVHTLTSTGNLPPYVRNLNCHPLYTRTYSPLEYKILGGFTKGFQIAGEWTRAYKQIANSVPPLLMKAIAEHVKNNILSSHKE